MVPWNGPPAALHLFGHGCVYSVLGLLHRFFVERSGEVVVRIDTGFGWRGRGNDMPPRSIIIKGQLEG
jgi:hypothetical protein